MSLDERRAKSTAWALTFADVVSLLLTFFVLLLVMLSDAEKRLSTLIEKLLDEYGSILEDIAEREAILADPVKLTEVIREELEAVRNQFGDGRRSEIIESHLSLSTEDLILLVYDWVVEL